MPAPFRATTHRRLSSPARAAPSRTAPASVTTRVPGRIGWGADVCPSFTTPRNRMNGAWLQITSGQGPAECCWVVARLLTVLERDAVASGLSFRVLESTAGDEPDTFRSALVCLEGDATTAF